MAEKKNRVRHWRGTADAYNTLVLAGALDYWTRYSVKYVDEGTGMISWKEYYGDNLITESTGQLLPVIDIVSALPTSLNPGDRYLVGRDGIGYFLVNVGLYREDAGGYAQTTKTQTFEEGISVRVKNRGYKSYLVIDKNIRTYDDVDCGSYE